MLLLRVMLALLAPLGLLLPLLLLLPLPPPAPPPPAPRYMLARSPMRKPHVPGVRLLVRLRWNTVVIGRAVRAPPLRSAGVLTLSDRRRPLPVASSGVHPRGDAACCCCCCCMRASGDGSAPSDELSVV